VTATSAARNMKLRRSFVDIDCGKEEHIDANLARPLGTDDYSA